MSRGRRYFAKPGRDTVVLPVGALEAPRRRGLLLWLSALAVLLYIAQLYVPDSKAVGACERSVPCLPDRGPVVRS